MKRFLDKAISYDEMLYYNIDEDTLDVGEEPDSTTESEQTPQKKPVKVSGTLGKSKPKKRLRMEVDSTSPPKKKSKLSEKKITKARRISVAKERAKEIFQEESSQLKTRIKQLEAQLTQQCKSVCASV